MVHCALNPRIIKDAFRAQYFLSSLNREIENLESKLKKENFFSNSSKNFLNSYFETIAHELDQVLLPTIVYEINKAKSEGKLFGNCPQDRYESFFVDGIKYTETALSIISNYPFLFEVIDSFITMMCQALLKSILRFKESQINLFKWLKIPLSVKIKEISPLNGSDRHFSQQSLLYILSDDTKIIYKPVDLHPNILLNKYIEILDLKYPYDLQKFETLSMGEYGWTKYIEHEPCENLEDISNFYRRAGTLLSIADSLNYTDGHCENFIAKGSFPILIDCETLFQNFDDSVLKHKNILTTGMIQKITDCNETHFLNSLFQAPVGLKHDYLNPHAIYDHTDEIELRYQKTNFSPQHHYPYFKGKPYAAHEYIPYIKEGYCHGYKLISANVNNILNDQKWWSELENIKIRVVLRDTLSYLYLVRKTQQPESMRSKKLAETIILNKLGSTPYSSYETKELLSLNIPYFFYYPNAKDLYDGHGHQYSNVFSETGVLRLRHQFLQRSNEKMQFDCKILQKHLVPYL
ncbi:DUF4135 domain-containing protein [Candidatus Protochlamydia sp. R18]|uniref:DUF4135 domain-containing protein n=1 Tax=Candidatus Protochlamydia sp. R18 TaxID=1353977 RepID=UPI0005AB3B1D|nr:DUF4135 domain-containing protein [Candidatus Protochlamydia sp. R18]